MFGFRLFCFCAGVCLGMCCYLALSTACASVGRLSTQFLSIREEYGIAGCGMAHTGSDGHEAARPSIGLVLRMVAVAVQSGASIPRALEQVGQVLSGPFAYSLRIVADGLLRGYAWHDVWIRAGGEAVSEKGGRNWFGESSHSFFGERDEKDLFLLRDALEDSWMRGSSPISRLESTIEQIDARQRHDIEQASSKLSVKILMPTGLCFLPAFMLIGVIPAVASFVS